MQRTATRRRWRIGLATGVAAAMVMATAPPVSAHELASLYVTGATGTNDVCPGGDATLYGKGYIYVEDDQGGLANIAVHVDQPDGPIIAFISPRQTLSNVSIHIPGSISRGPHTLVTTQRATLPPDNFPGDDPNDEGFAGPGRAPINVTEQTCFAQLSTADRPQVQTFDGEPDPGAVAFATTNGPEVFDYDPPAPDATNTDGNGDLILQERFGDWFNPEEWFTDNSGVTSGGVHLHCGIIACTVYFSRNITNQMAEQNAWEPAKATGVLCATLPALAAAIAAKGGLVGVAAEAVAAPVVAAASFEGIIAATMCGLAVTFYGYTGWWTAKEAKSKNKCLSLRNSNVFNPFSVATWTASGGEHCHDN